MRRQLLKGSLLLALLVLFACSACGQTRFGGPWFGRYLRNPARRSQDMNGYDITGVDQLEATSAAVTILSVGGSPVGTPAMSSLTDVDLTTNADGFFLRYKLADTTWYPIQFVKSFITDFTEGDYLHTSGDESATGTKTFDDIKADSFRLKDTSYQSLTYYVATTGLPTNTGLSLDQALDHIETALQKFPVGYRGTMLVKLLPGNHRGFHFFSGGGGNSIYNGVLTGNAGYLIVQGTSGSYADTFIDKDREGNAGSGKVYIRIVGSGRRVFFQDITLGKTASTRFGTVLDIYDADVWLVDCQVLQHRGDGIAARRSKLQITGTTLFDASGHSGLDYALQLYACYFACGDLEFKNAQVLLDDRSVAYTAKTSAWSSAAGGPFAYINDGSAWYLEAGAAETSEVTDYTAAFWLTRSGLLHLVDGNLTISKSSTQSTTHAIMLHRSRLLTGEGGAGALTSKVITINNFAVGLGLYGLSDAGSTWGGGTHWTIQNCGTGVYARDASRITGEGTTFSGNSTDLDLVNCYYFGSWYGYSQILIPRSTPPYTETTPEGSEWNTDGSPAAVDINYMASGTTPPTANKNYKFLNAKWRLVTME